MLGAILKALASPRLMAAFFLLMAGAALAVAYEVVAPTPAALLPLGLLVVNLTASIASNARFRADLPLLAFHVSLLAFVALLAVARLTYFEGTAKLLVGERFTGEFLTAEAGPLHGDGSRALRFANEGFTESYPERNLFRYTNNRIRFTDGDGAQYDGVIGDDLPLVQDGYRIYTARSRGFAPMLEWLADDGTIQLTTVALGPIDADGFSPGVEWNIAGGPRVWVSLSTERNPPVPGTSRQDLGAKEARNKLVVRHGERFHDVQRGESVTLPGGRLTFTGLNAWMGYRIIYDPTKPWVIGTIAAAIVSLLWFYARRLWRTWDED